MTLSILEQAGLSFNWSQTPKTGFLVTWLNIIHYSTSIIVFFSLCCVMLPVHLGRVKRISYLSLMRAAKVQASLRIRAVSPEPPLLAHASSKPRGTFRQKARSLAPLNGCACAVKICHDGMLKDTNSLDAPHFISFFLLSPSVEDVRLHHSWNCRTPEC